MGGVRVGMRGWITDDFATDGELVILVRKTDGLFRLAVVGHCLKVVFAYTRRSAFKSLRNISCSVAGVSWWEERAITEVTKTAFGMLKSHHVECRQAFDLAIRASVLVKKTASRRRNLRCTSRRLLIGLWSELLRINYM